MNDQEYEVDWNAIEIQLLPAERKLLLKYGFPLESERLQLESMVKSKQLIETLVISRYRIHTLLGDLSYCINKKTTGRVRNALIELCDRLEDAEALGDGDLDISW